MISISVFWVDTAKIFVQGRRAMLDIFESLKEYFDEYVVNTVKTMRIIDSVDIFVLALISFSSIIFLCCFSVYFLL